jgi:uncharacterized protein (DUF58 family)
MTTPDTASSWTGFDPAILARCRLPVRAAKGVSRPGAILSNHPGSGWEMHSVRSYEYGDDPRRVDWNASARTGELQVRTGLADVSVQLHLLPLLDGSMRFGPARTKHDAAVEALAFLTALAARHGDRTTLQTGPRERLLLPARRPETLLRALLESTPDWGDTAVSVETLESLRPPVRPTLLTVVADLLSLPGILAALENDTRDLLLIVVVDPLEIDPPVAAPVLVDHRGAGFHHGGITGPVRERYLAEVDARLASARRHVALVSGTLLVLRTDDAVPTRMLELLGGAR